MHKFYISFLPSHIMQKLTKLEKAKRAYGKAYVNYYNARLSLFEKSEIVDSLSQ